MWWWEALTEMVPVWQAALIVAANLTALALGVAVWVQNRRNPPRRMVHEVVLRHRADGHKVTFTTSTGMARTKSRKELVAMLWRIYSRDEYELLSAETRKARRGDV
jgi:hypothetical protein